MVVGLEILNSVIVGYYSLKGPRELEIESCLGDLGSRCAKAKDYCRVALTNLTGKSEVEYDEQNERRDDYLEHEKSYRGAVALVFFIFDLGVLAVYNLFFFHAIPSHSVSGMPRLPK